MYFLEALILNGEDDVSLIRKRRSISGEHSLRIVVNAVRYVVRMNSRACLCYQRKKLLSRDRREI